MTFSEVETKKTERQNKEINRQETERQREIEKEQTHQYIDRRHKDIETHRDFRKQRQGHKTKTQRLIETHRDIKIRERNKIDTEKIQISCERQNKDTEIQTKRQVLGIQIDNQRDKRKGEKQTKKEKQGESEKRHIKTQ